MKRVHSAKRRILIRQFPQNYVALFHIRNIYDQSGWHAGASRNYMRPIKEPCLFRHGRKL